MPDRLRLIDGAYEWTAEVAADEVRLSAGKVGIPEQAAESSPSTFMVRRVADNEFEVDGPEGHRQAFAVLASDVVWVSIEGHVFDIQISTGGRTTRSTTRDQDALAPPMSATVVRIAVAPGDHVKQGDLLVSLEAMKMELPIRAPRDGIVKAVHCREGELVQPGNVLVEM
jgi:3-methylcrotonyl-CoA carboxylase alpha subunit